MKASELRIGNWVCGYHKKEYKVTSNIISILEKTEDWVNPIPLTEEWILKFGEIWDDDYRMFFNLENNHLYCDENLAECHRISWIKIKYVHQLQNLYFALTGKELKIKQ